MWREERNHDARMRADRGISRRGGRLLAVDRHDGVRRRRRPWCAVCRWPVDTAAGPRAGRRCPRLRLESCRSPARGGADRALRPRRRRHRVGLHGAVARADAARRLRVVQRFFRSRRYAPHRGQVRLVAKPGGRTRTPSLHLLLLGGDQIYADGLWRAIDELRQLQRPAADAERQLALASPPLPTPWSATTQTPTASGSAPVPSPNCWLRSRR